MTIAEKHFRRAYRIKADVKITNEQWKVINMMHACLKENNEPKLPHGTMLIDKKMFVEHLASVQKCLKDIDALMADENSKVFANSINGRKLAEISNRMQFTLHGQKAFQLNIPLERLNDEIKLIEA